MDEWSHRFANALVGNDENDATLEMVLAGPSLRVTAPRLHRGLRRGPGADGRRRRSGTEPLPHGRPVWIRDGARIDFGPARSGLHAYLAVHGGFDVPLVMGSRSTYLRGGFGGHQGRALAVGDRLSGDRSGARPPTANREPGGDAADGRDVLAVAVRRRLSRRRRRSSSRRRGRARSRRCA